MQRPWAHPVQRPWKSNAEDPPQLTGLVIDDLVFEMSERDGTVQQEGVEGSKDAEGGERAGEEHLAGLVRPRARSAIHFKSNGGFKLAVSALP